MLQDALHDHRHTGSSGAVGSVGAEALLSGPRRPQIPGVVLYPLVLQKGLGRWAPGWLLAAPKSTFQGVLEAKRRFVC